MSMEKKNLLYLFASFCLLVAMTVGASRLREAERSNQAYQDSNSLDNNSRFPASVRNRRMRKGIKRGTGFLLSQREVLALKEKDLEKYLKGVAKTLARAGKKNPKLFYDSSVKTSQIWLYLQSEAFAQSSVSFENGCLIGFVAAVQADCSNGRRGFSGLDISATTRDRFSSVSSNGTSARCPSGRQMCSPAIYGFNFDADGKASLICLPNASGQECFNNVSTNGQGDRLKKSLELLAEANPDFWNNLGKGITEICKPTSGGPEADATKADCALLKRQLSTLTQESRGALDEYKNLYALANGDTNSLDPLAQSAQTPVPGGGGETVRCSEVESAMKSQISSNLDFDQMDRMSGAGDVTANTDLLRFASVACNKSAEELISQYGDCNISTPSGARDTVASSRADASAKIADARGVVALINALPSSFKNRINENTSLVRARSILTGSESTDESRAAFEAWRTYYRSHRSGTRMTDKGNPFEALASTEPMFEQVLNNAINGGLLTPDQQTYLQDFRYNYGMNPINIKSLFCPENGAESHTFPELPVANEANFRNYTLECLKQMGFGNRRNRPRTVTYPVLGSETESILERNCSWSSSNYDATIGSYFDGSASGLPENLYLKLRNQISRTDSCQKIQACTYSRTGTPVSSRALNTRGIMRNGECISPSSAMAYLSSRKDNISTISCSTRRTDNDPERTLSPAEIIDRDRGRVID